MVQIEGWKLLVDGSSVKFRFYCPPSFEAEELPIFHPDLVERLCVALSSKSLLSAVTQPTVKHVRQHLSCFHKENMTQGCGTPETRSLCAEHLQISGHRHVNLLCVLTPMKSSYLLFKMLINSKNTERKTRGGGSADHYLPYLRLTS